MSITLAFDATHLFISSLPHGAQACGYDTGKDGVAWTAADWAAHPGAVHIDQDPAASDATADVLDCENGAVPVGSSLIAVWAKRALANYAAAVRPGQRVPAVYCSASNVTLNVNALIAGGVRSGVGLWVADWSFTQAQAVADVVAAAGPFPVIGVQFTDDGDFDSDVFSTAWLQDVSGRQPPAPPWAFGPVRDVTWKAGITSFEVTFSSPATPEPLGVAEYEIAVCTGSSFTTDTASYPRYVPKGASPQVFQGGSLQTRTLYTAGVRAIATDGHHAGPWVIGQFTTGG